MPAGKGNPAEREIRDARQDGEKPEEIVAGNRYVICAGVEGDTLRDRQRVGQDNRRAIREQEIPPLLHCCQECIKIRAVVGPGDGNLEILVVASRTAHLGNDLADGIGGSRGLGGGRRPGEDPARQAVVGEGGSAGRVKEAEYESGLLGLSVAWA